MPRTPLDTIKSHLQHDLRPHQEYSPVPLDLRCAQQTSKLPYLFVRQAGVSLADVEKAIARSDGERIIGEHRGAPSVTLFRRGNHHVELHTHPLPLVPLP